MQCFLVSVPPGSPPVRRISLSVAGAWLILFFALGAGAEEAEVEYDQATFRTVLQENRDAPDQFEEVQTYLLKGRPNLAFEMLYRMMEVSGEDVVKQSGVPKLYRHYSGVKQACRDRLWSLWGPTVRPGIPPGAELLQRYRDLYDPPATRRLAAARAARDVRELARVARDYLATEAGDDALLALGDLYAEQGNPAEALVYWEELLSRYGTWRTPAIAFEALTAKVVGAHLALGHRDAATRLVKGWTLGLRLVGALASWTMGDAGAQRRSGAELARAYLARPVRAGGRAVPFLELVRSMGAAVSRGRDSWSGDEWLTLGGGLEPEGFRTRVDGMGDVAWSVDFLDVRNRGDLPTVHGPEKQQAWGTPVVNLMDVGVNTGLVQPFHPIVSRGRVYVLNDVRGRVFDLATGAPAATFGDFVITPTAGFTVDDGLVRVPQGLAARGRFLVAVQRASFTGNPADDEETDPRDQLPSQTVSAFDLASGLRRLWDTADVKDERSREFYDGACFHGPPALDEHSAYVGAYVLENDVRAYLCSIDLRTGRLQWATFLCAEQLSSFTSVNPRPGLAPVKVDGLVVWCSNQGVIGAFDALTGEVRWLLQYPRRVAYTYGGNVDMTPGWSDNPPVVTDRVLFVTPQDAEWLVSADIRTGRPYSFHPRAVEGDASFRHMVAGARGEVYLLGAKPAAGRTGRDRSRSRNSPGVGRIVRFDPRDPGSAGVALDLPDEITGRGRAVDGALYCPTRKGLYVADYSDPRRPVLRGPMVSWEDPAGLAREVVVLRSVVLVARGDGRLEAYPVKH